MPRLVLPGPTCPKNWEHLLLQVELLATSIRDGCASCACTDTYKSRTAPAGDGVEIRDGTASGTERTAGWRVFR